MRPRIRAGQRHKEIAGLRRQRNAFVGVVVTNGAARHADRFQLAGHGAGDGFFLPGDALHGQEALQAIDGCILVEREIVCIR